MTSRYLDIVAIVFVASLLCPSAALGQTASQTPSSADTLGVACAPNGALSYNGNSFVSCTSGVWAIEPVTIGTASVAPATCNGAAEGMLYFDTGSTAVKVCTGSSWIAVGSGAPIAGGSSTDVQFNDSGVLSGDSGFTYAGANGNVYIAGNVGIGTTVPQHNVDVWSSGATSIGISNGGTGGYEYDLYSTSSLDSGGAGNFGIFQRATPGSGSGNFVFYINTSGNVGIGTTSPGALFTVGNNTFEVNSSGAITAASLTTTNGVALTNIAQIATNTILGNATSGTANVTALSIGGCSSASSALIWTTNTGFGCNTSVTASTSPNVTTTAVSTNSNFFPLFVASSTNSSQAVDLSTVYTVNASTGGVTTGGAIAIGTTSTDGLFLANTTAATPGAGTSGSQFSPRLHFEGQGWKTWPVIPASQPVDFIEELQPQEGGANPSGNLTWSGSVNGGAYNPIMTLTTGGSLGIGTTVPMTVLHVVGNGQSWKGVLDVRDNSAAIASATYPYISFYGSDEATNETSRGGVVGVSAGNFYVGADTGISSGNVYITAGSGLTPRVTITSGGNVGIGTTAPFQALDVNGDANIRNNTRLGTAFSRYLKIVGSNSPGAVTIQVSNTLGSDIPDSAVPLVLQPSAGNVGIGTTAPLFNLDIWASSGTDTVRVKNTSGGSQIAIDRGSTSSNSQFFFSTAGSEDFAFGTGLGGAGASDFGIYDAFTSANAITIKQSNGYVGIGTTAPALTFQVHTGTNQNISLNAPVSQTLGGRISTFSDAGNVYEPMEMDASKLIINNNSGGSVGIGMSPTWTLDTSNSTYGARVNTWSDIGGTVCGLGYVGDNLYMNEGTNAWEWTNTHASLGGAAIQFLQCSSGLDDILFLSETGASTANAAASPTTNMIIKANGYVGIGTTTPESPLHVYDGSHINGTLDQVLTIQSDENLSSGGAGGAATIAFQGFTGYSGAIGGYDVSGSSGVGLGIWVGTNGSAVNPNVYINSSGNVGIATTSPSAVLHSYASSSASSALRLEAQNDNPWDVQILNDSYSTSWSNAVTLWQQHTGSFGIGNNGNSCSMAAGGSGWSCSSDIRLKKNIQTFSVLDKLKDYRAVSFDWKKTNKRDLGVIAQELYKVFPELVMKGSGPDDVELSTLDERTWSVNYDHLAALALEGVKELLARSSSDHAALAKLQADNDNLCVRFDGDHATITQLKADNDSLRARLNSDEHEIAELKRQMHAQ